MGPLGAALPADLNRMAPRNVLGKVSARNTSGTVNARRNGGAHLLNPHLRYKLRTLSAKTVEV